MYKVTFLSIFHLSNSPLTETQIQRYLSHVGTQVFHVNSFSKEKECREIALKSTGDLPVKVKHTSTFYHWDGWLFGVCIWVGSLISKHTTQVYEHLVAFKFPALLPNDSVFALFFFCGREIKREYFGCIFLTGECANDRNTLKQFIWIKVLFGM